MKATEPEGAVSTRMPNVGKIPLSLGHQNHMGLGPWDEKWNPFLVQLERQ